MSGWIRWADEPGILRRATLTARVELGIIRRGQRRCVVNAQHRDVNVDPAIHRLDDGSGVTGDQRLDDALLRFVVALQQDGGKMKAGTSATSARTNE